MTLLLEVSVKATLLIAGTGALLLLFAKSSAARRHAVLAWTFVALGALAPLTAWVPTWELAVLPAATKEEVQTTWPTSHQVGPIDSLQPWQGTEYDAAPLHAELDVAKETAPSSMHSIPRSPLASKQPSIAASFDASIALWILWAVGFVWSLLKFAASLFQMMHVHRRATPVLSTNVWQQTIDELRAFHPQTQPHLREAEACLAPWTWGWRRGVIVVPSRTTGWTSARRRTSLLHELAHIQRRDWLVQTIARFVCALYWFHPAAWLAARQLELEAERACDDSALLHGARPSDYAELLIELSHGSKLPLHSVSGSPRAALGMARGTPLARRIRSILDPDCHRSDMLPTLRSASFGALALAAPLAAAQLTERPSLPSPTAPALAISTQEAAQKPQQRPLKAPTVSFSGPSNASLEGRWKWAWDHIGERDQTYWVVYSTHGRAGCRLRLDPPILQDAERRPSLSERIPDESSDHKAWDRYLESGKFPADEQSRLAIACQVRGGGAEGTPVLESVVTTAMWCPHDASHELLWLGEVDSQVSFHHLKHLRSRTLSANASWGATFAIAQHGHREVVSTLASILQEEKSEAAKGQVIQLLPFLGCDDDVAPLLLRTANEASSLELCRSAILYLSLLQDSAALPALESLGRNRKDPFVSGLALAALGRSAPESARRLYLNRLASPIDTESAYRAVLGLRQVGKPSDLVEVLFGNYDLQVRKQALSWLGYSDEQALLEAAARVLQNAPTELQQQAIYTLGLHYSRATRELLEHTARTHPNDAMRQQAVHRIGAADDLRSKHFLQEILNEEASLQVHEAALRGFYRRNDRKDLEQIALEHTSLKVRQRALWFLSRMNG